MEIQINKNIIRKEILSKRNSLDEGEVFGKSQKIFDYLVSTKEYINADKILLYYSYNNEVLTKSIFEDSIKKGKQVAYPKCIKTNTGWDMDFYYLDELSQLSEGYKGIFEPDNEKYNLIKHDNKSGLCIIPCSAFDEKGHRIGYGKGFYDKYLCRHNVDCKIALAYELQKTNRIDTEETDINMNMVITENQIYYIDC